jgi:hypothetical protein
MNLVWSLTDGFVEIWFFLAEFVTVGKNGKKTGFWEILTADVGGCMLMDADEFSLVFDRWVRRNLFFSSRVCYCGQKW